MRYSPPSRLATSAGVANLQAPALRFYLRNHFYNGTDLLLNSNKFWSLMPCHLSFQLQR